MTAKEIDHERRAFLRGRHLAARAGLPLPWTEDGGFAAGCTACGACAAACPEEIVKTGAGGLPHIDFATAGCSFCGACAAACPEALFDRRRSPALPLALDFAESCLARQAVVCQSCRDACPEGAIVFTPTLGRVARPQLRASACSACGLCVAACPVSAVSLRRAADSRPAEAAPCA